MPLASLVLATLAALLHVFFWVLESLRWRRPDVWKRFGAKSQEEADVIAPMAYNQGFYNLFLAIGTLVGVVVSVVARGDSGWTMYAPEADPPSTWDQLSHALQSQPTGTALIAFGLLCMLGAALVLVLSNRKMARAAVIQGGFPALALIIALVA
ncbi:MAG: DUF1304 domain-containing protein [Solirubrobacteraceae bacterium]|nr:DUF1304 domain-containing protein [Solirubrobacteraceae bacterium]